MKQLSAALFLFNIISDSSNEVSNVHLIQNTLPLILVITMRKFSMISNGMLSFMPSAMLLNQYNLWAICALSCYKFVSSILRTIELSVAMNYIPLFIISIVTLGVYQVFYSRRSHKNGGLVMEETKGMHILITLSLGYFLMKSLNEMNAIIVTPYALGGLLASLFMASIAFVADNWYIVGTGQFYMVALDTVGIFFYFILPAIVLLVRFFDKYESTFSHIATYVGLQVKNILEGINILGTDTNEFEVQHDLILLMFLTANIGVSLIQNLCPIAGHLFSRTYTHGHPNTKKVAICVDFDDLKEIHDELNSLGNQKVLNIFVTLDDLNEHREMVQKLYQAGHHFGITLAYEGDASAMLLSTFNLFEKVLGVKPHWCCCRYHNCYQAAQDLDIQCVLWSTLLNNPIVNPSMLKSNVYNDLKSHNGGNIIFCKNSLNNKDALQKVKTVTECIIELGMKAEKVSDLIGDLSQMSL